MTDFLTKNVVAIILAGVSFVSMYAVNSYRIQALEDRQDRQGTAVMLLQSQQTDGIANYAALDAKLDAVIDNVSYIRSRIDSIVK